MRMARVCGIAGIFAFSDNSAPDEATIAGMVNAIRHRGPDEQAWLVRGRIGLGVARLSIIDPAGSHQPLKNESGNVAVVFNGEIYNYKELRTELQKAGHDFATQGDGEVIVHGYEEWGREVFGRLRGMFAVALWDDATATLLLARDRMGIKPLYVYRGANRLLFASEVKALLASGDVRAEMRPEMVDAYLAFRYVPGPQTMFRGVEKVRPGEYRAFHGANETAHTYHRHEFSPKIKIGEDEAAEQLQTLFNRSIEYHLQSDVPLGVFLSGGLDSSFLAALAREHVGQSLDTFTVGFDRGGIYDETGAAEFTSRRLDTRQHSLHMSAFDFATLLPEAIGAMDEPMADPSAAPMMALSRVAAEHVRVVLSGEGADELFAGYPRYYGEAMAARLWVPRELSRLAASVLPLSRAHRRGVEGVGIRDSAARHLFWQTIISEAARGRLHQPLSSENSPLSMVRRIVDGDDGDAIDRLFALDLRYWLVEDLLLKKDKMGMSASIEARVPYLDQDIVAFALRLPTALKVQGLRGKRVFRRMLENYLPAEVLGRPKIGFAVPLSDWFRGELRSSLETALTGADTFLAPYLSGDEVRDMMGRHMRGANLSLELFTLLVLELWGRIYIRGESPGEVSAQAFRAASV